jgi:ubiquinone/menaquinone biosynthesis C-methylase UbiE
MLDPHTFKQNEQDAWDLCAETYDQCLLQPFTTFARHLVDLAGLHTENRVLDVATGTGLAALMAAELLGPRAKIVGVDLSETMIGIARKRAAEQGMGNVEFARMDAERLDFPDNCFDAVLCALGLMLFPQPEVALSEMLRVLKKGGTAALSVFGRGSKVALRAFMEPFIPHMPPPPQRGPSTFGFGRNEALREALEQAGFSDVKVEERAHVLEFETAEEVWNIPLSLGRLAQMQSRLPAEARQELKRQVLHIATEKYLSARGGFELPFGITYAVAHKPS